MLPFGAKQFAHEADIRIYGKIWPHDCNFLRSYQRHHADVLDYFCGKSQRMLRLEISLGGGWDELCRFLDAPHPNISFPHHNKRWTT